MIIRGYLECATCGHPYIVRIGMGQETRQRHQFSCRSCHEAIEVGLDINYQQISVQVFFGKNAVATPPATEGTVVNLDANFLIPEEDQGKELVFPRLRQGASIAQKLMEERRRRGLPETPELGDVRSNARPDFAAEWKDLRIAWSLSRNGKADLSARQVAKASADKYADEPLNDLADWVWRFVLALTGPRYQALLNNALEQIKQAKANDDFGRFCKSFEDNISERHGRIFFDLMKDYFEGFDEFAQVQFLVTSGAVFPDAKAASSNFDSIRLFYGNAFEAFAGLVEFFAYLNNLIVRRKFDEFESMTVGKYLRLDKAARFSCFAANDGLSAVCVEADNVLRNASHHNDLVFDAATQDISYRDGKGGQGNEHRISYTNYVRRCTELFLQAAVLLGLELVFASSAKLRPPL